MADVFSYDNVPATEVWSISGAYLQYNSSSVPFICNQLQLTYRRTINPMYPINVLKSGSLHRIDIAGNPDGSLTLGVLLGPTTDLNEFMEAVSKNTCDTNSDMTFDIQPFDTATCVGSTAKKNLTYHLSGLVLTNLGLTIQNQQGIATVSQPMQFMFTSLDIQANG